ncbi:hypothetical protein [Serratia inhibens]|uniref:hypothetical protein n=1 Tax=Serratia inhibens TaxID=2338073 RepID=UPI0032174289
MDNKLSELSKPAWIVGEKEIADFMRGDEALLVRGHDPDGTKPALRMYSQEYVSALLTELEEKQKSIAELEKYTNMVEWRICAPLEKRIAELERANKSQDDHINQQQDRIESLERTNASLGRGLAAAEKRLATPVRLPVPYSENPWMSPDPDGTWFDKGDVKESIRSAGFTVSEV